MKSGQSISPGVDNIFKQPLTTPPMSSTPISDYIKSLDAFSSPSSVLKGFVMMAAAKYSTTVFYIAGKASADSFGPFDGVYVPYNGSMDWMPFDKTQEFPHGMATWVLPWGSMRSFSFLPKKTCLSRGRSSILPSMNMEASPV